MKSAPAHTAGAAQPGPSSVAKPRFIPPQKAVAAMALPQATANELIALSGTGDWPALEARALEVTKRYPGHFLGWKAMGKAQVQQGKVQEALGTLQKLTQLVPRDADALNDLGVVLQALQRPVEAEASFRKAIASDANFAQSYANLGMLLDNVGRQDEAVTLLRQALKLNPGAAGTHNNLGSALQSLGRFKEAEPCFRQALALHPNYLEAWLNLGAVLMSLEQFGEAEQCVRQALRVQPDSALALYRLGELLIRLSRVDAETIACLERAIALDPSHVDARIALGNALMRAGQNDKAQAMFREAQALRPLITWPANTGKADFSALFLDAAGPGSTPVNYLAGRASYDRHFYAVTAGVEPDWALLRSKADVVFNMLGDADNGGQVLPLALQIADRLERPVLNHPRKVMATDRESIAQRLAGIPYCRVPKTLRFSGEALLQAAAARHVDGIELPCLARLAGTHGGDDLDKFDDWDAIAAFVAKRPQETYYLSEYIDYRLADGFFRKYRVICMDGQLWPYHLAIHNDWKVHYFRTDMGQHDWMLKEEEVFLTHIDQVFDADRMAALRAIGAATGLNYCGIDCALDRNGDVLVFEANATMLVHAETTERFAFKNPYIAKIKDGFDAMLRRHARGA